MIKKRKGDDGFKDETMDIIFFTTIQWSIKSDNEKLLLNSKINIERKIQSLSSEKLYDRFFIIRIPKIPDINNKSWLTIPKK